MQTNTTTKNAGGASAAVDFASVLEKAGELASKVTDVMCLATMQEERLSQHLFPGVEHPDYPGCFYFSPVDKKMVCFTSHELQERAEALDDLADELYETLHQMREKLAINQPPLKPAPIPKSGLGDVISKWEDAYTALIATERDGGIPDDAPEHDVEEKALLALADFHCASLAEVRRKASLFLRHPYLKERALAFNANLMRSFAGAM